MRGQVGLPILCVPFIATQVSLGMSLVHAGISTTVLNYNASDLGLKAEGAVRLVGDGCACCALGYPVRL